MDILTEVCSEERCGQSCEHLIYELVLSVP